MHYFGFDIGGANIKWADLDGNAFEKPFAIWQHPNQLPSVLSKITSDFPIDARLGVTMTAELADCFESKREGVKFIVDSVLNTLPRFKPLFYQTTGELCAGAEAIESWHYTAASNWHATANYLFAIDRLNVSGFVVDIGSTTTDLIPVINGTPVVSNQNDFERLSNGQLVYAGVGRTPVFGILSELNLRGSVITIARENFATLADVFRWRKEIPEDFDSTATADGRPASRAHSGKRIARLVCADSGELETDEIDSISSQVKAAFISLIAQQLQNVLRAHPEVPLTFKTLGRGSFTAEKIIREALASSQFKLPIVLEFSPNPTLNQSVPALAVAYFRAQLDRENG